MVINSCTVTNEADKNLEYVIRRTRRKHPKLKILLTGCYVENHLEELSSGKLVDGVIKKEDKYKIPEQVYKTEEVSSEFDANFDSISKISRFDGHTRAFVKVQDGCDRSCAFCIITVVRPSLESRGVEEIYEEVKELVSNGYGEIVLTGIQLGAYGKDIKTKTDLSDLLERLVLIDGIERIRLSSINPWNLTDKLIDTIKENSKICKHLHIAIQSGSDSVLFRMYRGYKMNYLNRILGRIRTEMPCFTFSADIIAGFPGETEEEHQETVSFIDKLQPMKLHVFPYSDRRGTAAEKMNGKVNTAIKKARVAELIDLSDKYFEFHALNCLGSEQAVLVERVIETESGFHFYGKLENYLPVIIEGSEKVESGEIVIAKIKDFIDGNLIGFIKEGLDYQGLEKGRKVV